MAFWRRIWFHGTRRAENDDADTLRVLVDELRDAVATLQREVDVLRSQNQHVNDAPFSKSEVARRLRVSRSRTLLPAIALGKVRTVKFGKEERIPLCEIVRLREEGFGNPKGRRSRSGRTATAAAKGDTEAVIARLNKMKY